MLLSQKLQKVYDKMMNGKQVYMVEIVPLIEEAKQLEQEKGIDQSEEIDPVEYLPYF